MAFRRFPIKSFLTFSRNVSNKVINIKEIGPGGFALLAVPITTFCLGTWQVKRRTWKLNLIDEVTKKSLEPPVELPENLDELSKMEYQKVKVRGRFDHSKELYIGPRQLLKSDVEGGGLMSSQAKSGYHVITPFQLTDRNVTILVNRGWVPKKNMNPATRPEAQMNDEIEFTGAVRLPETRPQFSPKIQPGSHFFLYRDVPRMAEMTASEEIFIDACADSTIPGGPVGGQTRITFRNDHLSYLITWYSLSAATSYMWYKKYIKGVKILVITILLSGRARFLLLSCVASLTSRRDIKSLIPLFSYGDWFLLYLLADNIDNLHFREFVRELKPKDTETGLPYKLPQIDDVDKGKKVFIGNESTSLLDNNESTV